MAPLTMRCSTDSRSALAVSAARWWFMLLGSVITASPCRAAPAAPAEPAAARATDERTAPPDAEDRWCAPELESLPNDVCVALPAHADAPPREVAIFLHGVIAPDASWQWAQQRSAARAVAGRGVAVLMPRGRRGLRTDSMRDWTTWPTSAAAQRLVERELLAEWLAARTALAARFGRAFERTYLLGFSNGAYYASSLALRGRLPIDGYAAFAGGVAPGPIRPKAYAAVERVPFYVGYGDRDPAARHDGRSFEHAFRLLGWPGKVVSSKRVGHTMTDAQVKAAIEFFRAKRPLGDRDASGRPTDEAPDARASAPTASTRTAR